MDYLNPFSGMPNPQMYSSPFMRAGEEERRVGQAMPFVQNSLQRQQIGLQDDQLGLQKKQMEFGEFSSPTAVQGRESARQLGLMQNQSGIRNQPFVEQSDRLKYDQLIQTLPPQTLRMVEEEAQKLSAAKGAPVAKLYSQLADLYSQIEKAPPAVQSQMYAQFLQRFEQENPGQKLPDSMKQFGPETMNGMRNAYLVARNPVAHQRQMEIEEQKDKAQIQIGEGNNRASIRVAEINAARDRERQQFEGNRDRTEGQRILRLRQELSNRNTTPERREEIEETLYGAVSGQIEQRINNDPGLQSMALGLGTDGPKGEKSARYHKHKATLKFQELMRQGLRPKMADLREMFPNLKPDVIRQQFKEKYGIEPRN